LVAGRGKSFPGCFQGSVITTRNLLDALIENRRLKRFVNVSSFAVYSRFQSKRGALWDEACPLEDNLDELHDAYAYGKLRQDELVQDYHQRFGVPFTIVRPGIVFGPGKMFIPGFVGMDTFGFFMHLGGGGRLPLTYVDNCAEAIVLAAFKPGVDGETFNVVDDEKMTSREFLAARKSVKSFFSVWIPYRLAYLGSVFWENYSKKSGGQLPPVFNRRRCAAEWQGNRYSNQKLRDRLGWKQKVPLAGAMKIFLAQYQ
jgi:nucleoside-diphosphate-sugar epimerase